MQVFDPGYKKRSRKNVQASDRAAEAEAEARLRGPHTFSLERLLHIFYVLCQREGAEEEEEGEEGEAAEGRANKKVSKSVGVWSGSCLHVWGWAEVGGMHALPYCNRMHGPQAAEAGWAGLEPCACPSAA